MENCLYHGRTICTYDLKDDIGLYYEDMVLEWKQAAADRQLTCVECGAHVYLAAGPIKEPYFAHYDLNDCDYGSGHETEELKKGKRLLYHILKRSFPDRDVRARFRMENGMFSTLYCLAAEDINIAVDYRLQNNSLQKFNLRDTFYQANHIKPIYIMGIRQEKNTRQIDWYQNLLQTSMGYIAFLDTEQESMTLKRSFSYRLGKERKYMFCIKTYPVKDLILSLDGKMLCDFIEECVKIEKQIIEEKENFGKRQEKLKKIRDENLRLQEEEANRQEAYRRLKVQEEKNRQEYLQKSIERKDVKTQEFLQESSEQEEVKTQEDCQNSPNKENIISQEYDKSFSRQEQAEGQNVYLGYATLNENLIQRDQNNMNGYKDESKQINISPSLNPEILEKCKKMIEEGNAHLVSKKYYNAIMGIHD